jgi:hypothetical protein
MIGSTTRRRFQVGWHDGPQTRTPSIMKNPRALLAFTVVLALVGCQSIASSDLIYTFDQNFLAYFGPEGVTEIQNALREAHSNDMIQVGISDSDK